jgi:hypothetical protein
MQTERPEKWRNWPAFVFFEGVYGPTAPALLAIKPASTYWDRGLFGHWRLVFTKGKRQSLELANC